MGAHAALYRKIKVWARFDLYARERVEIWPRTSDWPFGEPTRISVAQSLVTIVDDCTNCGSEAICDDGELAMKAHGDSRDPATEISEHFVCADCVEEVSLETRVDLVTNKLLERCAKCKLHFIPDRDVPELSICADCYAASFTNKLIALPS